MDLFFEKEKCLIVKMLKEIKKARKKWINSINLLKIVIMLNNLKWQDKCQFSSFLISQKAIDV